MDEKQNDFWDKVVPDAKVSGVLRSLRKNYMLVGNTHIKTWHGLLVLGIAIGLVVGVIAIANRKGKLEGSQAAGSVAGIQTLSVNGNNIYSPMLVLFNGQPRLYFGGWLEAGLTHDNIYVVDCPFGEGLCSNARKVIDSATNGFEHVNDPTVVLHPATQASSAYYIMYFTGVPAGESGLNLTSNRIYYSTSWADDGVNWSRPTLLLPGFWLPSATMKNGRVELFANSTTDGRVAKFDFGESGIEVGAPAHVSFDNPAAIPPFYSNVDVVWRPTLNAYQIFSERALRPTVDSTSVIDYLTSSDGITWHLANSSIIVPASGQFRVGTPAQWVDTASWVYFGSTAQSDSMGFKIYFARTDSSSPPADCLAHPISGSNLIPGVTFQANNNQFVVAEDGGCGAVRADQSAEGSWGIFTLKDANGGRLNNGDIVNIISSQGRYVTSENDVNGTINADRTAAGGWENFILVKVSGSMGNEIRHGDMIALKTWRGLYVAAENGGGSVLNGNRTAIGGWEAYAIRFAAPPSQSNNASCGTFSAPSSVIAGESFSATLTMNNIGTNGWVYAAPTDTGDYVVDPVSSAGNYSTFWGGEGAVPPFSPVNSGQSAILNINARAPATTGTYDFNWQMYKQNQEWFGQVCEKQIMVTTIPPLPPQNKFIIGDRVRATDTLAIRGGPTLGVTKAGKALPGDQGIVINGPRFAEGFTWWKVRWDKGIAGWSVENWMKKN